MADNLGSFGRFTFNLASFTSISPSCFYGELHYVLLTPQDPAEVEILLFFSSNDLFVFPQPPSEESLAYLSSAYPLTEDSCFNFIVSPQPSEDARGAGSGF